MIRFSQQLGYYIGIPLIPSDDILTAEDCRRFVGGREGLGHPDPTRIVDYNIAHGSHNGTEHLEQVSESVAPQNSSADPVSQSLPSNSQAIRVEKSTDTTFQDALHSSNTCIESIDQQNVNSQGTKEIGPEHRSDQSTAQVAEQGRVTTFQNAHHLNFSGNARIMNIGHQHINTHGNYGFDNLEKFVSFSALHDSSAQDPERRCHPDTRKGVLSQIHAWADNPSRQEGILWIHGPAGVGKSAIAQTIANSYDRDKLGATFFFFRSDPARNDGNRLFPTLAWQLALSVPTIRDLIASSLEEYPDLPRKAIEVQFNKLITQSFPTISGGESTAPTSTRVIVIDGLDECSDVKLQERILNSIGNAVVDTHFPLHFLISSRPEAHIQDFFDQFQHPVLQIDLANVDDAFRDIRTYFTSEFSRIAVEQRLDRTRWPAQGVIDTLVSKSSAQFVYASTVMKYIGDKYESAVTQLDVILGLKPSTGKSPFSELDALYMKILQRQTDQNFLKEFLPVLVAHSMLSDIVLEGTNLHDDYAMLLGLDVTHLHRKLRGMCSALKFKPFIDVHHKSFLDFLDDSSRSGEYHISKHFANSRYIQRITDLLVKAASRAMEQPDSHEGDHFRPRFANVIKTCPLKIKLPLNDLEKILRPLHIIQEKLLQLPNMSVPWKPRACDECWTFYMIDNLLLHLALLRGETRLQEPKYAGICPLTAMEEKESISQLDLDTCLSLLLGCLRGIESSLNIDTIALVRALVRFDPTETAMKIRSISDAQNLVELIFCLNKNECFKSWFGATTHNATRLAIAIYGRVPLLPRSLPLNSADLDERQHTYQGKTVILHGYINASVQIFLGAFICGSLSHENMGPLLGICSTQLGLTFMIFTRSNDSPVRSWRRSNNPRPSVSKIQQIFFEVAKVIQHIHSLSIVFGNGFSVFIDSDNHVKVLYDRFCPNNLSEEQFEYIGHDRSWYTLESNIRVFAEALYRILFNKESYQEVTFKTRPSEPENPDNLWQLMQWCCAEDPKERPTIDQVVQEMESWISLGQFTPPST